MKYFAKITIGDGRGMTVQNAVIMGRITWNSLPDVCRPLKMRTNIVLSKDYVDGCLNSRSLDSALDMAYRMGCPKVFVIGGECVYKEAIKHIDCNELILTEVCYKDTGICCDRYFPEYKDNWVCISEMALEDNEVYRAVVRVYGRGR
jgi:dihydrofolate reductase